MYVCAGVCGVCVCGRGWWGDGQQREWGWDVANCSSPGHIPASNVSYPNREGRAQTLERAAVRGTAAQGGAVTVAHLRPSKTSRTARFGSDRAVGRALLHQPMSASSSCRMHLGAIYERARHRACGGWLGCARRVRVRMDNVIHNSASPKGSSNTSGGEGAGAVYAHLKRVGLGVEAKAGAYAALDPVQPLILRHDGVGVSHDRTFAGIQVGAVRGRISEIGLLRVGTMYPGTEVI